MTNYMTGGSPTEPPTNQNDPNQQASWTGPPPHGWPRQPDRPPKPKRSGMKAALGVSAAIATLAFVGTFAAGEDSSPPPPPPPPTVSTTPPDNSPTTPPDNSPTMPPDENEVEVPAPPSELVGKWNGGPGDSSDWWLTIGPDGSYTLINDWLGLSDSGLVDASNHGFVAYNATGDATALDAAGITGCDWTIENSQDEVGDLYGYTFEFLRFCADSTSQWTR